MAATPYNPYAGQLVAGINGQQNAGIGGINNASGIQNPYNAGATGLAAASSSQIDPTQYSGAQLQQYENPYQSDVVNATMAQIQNQNQQQAAALQGNAVSAGAFGGDRAGVAQAQLAGQQDIANNATLANLNTSNFQDAQSEFNTQQGVGLGAAQNTAARQLAASQQLGNLGNAAQTEALTGANAQINAGTLQQSTQQAQDTAAYNQFLQQQAYPFQTTGWLANIVEGIGSQSGGTSTGQNTTQGGSGLSSVAGGLLGLASFLKDGGRVTKKAMGGGLSPYQMALDPTGGLGAGSYVTPANLAIGHTMPQGGAPMAAAAPNQMQDMTQMAKSVQGLGNTGIGDKIGDFLQDNFAKGGLVRPRFDDGGTVLDDAPPSSDVIDKLRAAMIAATPPTVKYAPGLSVPAQAPPADNGYAEPASPAANTRGLVPAFADKIQDLQQDAGDQGVPSTLISGYRDSGLQAKLYANYQAKQGGQPLPYPEVGNGNIAAPPGSSNHESGNAADVVANNPAQQSALIGLSQEPWRGLTNLAGIGDAPHFQNSTGQSAPADPAVASAYAPVARASATAPAAAAISNGLAAPNPDAPAPGATEAQDSRPGGLFGLHLSDAARQGMLAAGLGMMGGTSMNPFVNIGQGGLAGVKQYNDFNNLQSEIGLRRAQAERQMVETGLLPAQTAAELGLKGAQTGLTSAQASGAQSEAQIKSMMVKRMLDRLHAGAQEGSAKSDAIATATAPASVAATTTPSPMAGRSAQTAGAPAPNGPRPVPDWDLAALTNRQNEAIKNAQVNLPGSKEELEAIQQRINTIREGGLVPMQDGSQQPYPGFAQGRAQQAGAAAAATEAARVPAALATKAGETNYETNNKIKTDAASGAENGQNMLSQALALRNLMFDPKTGQPTVNSGPYGDKFVSAAATLKQFGVGDKVIKSLTGTDPNNAQEIEKLRTSLGSEEARADLAGSQIRVAEFQRFLASVPNSQLLPSAYKYIIDKAIIPKAQQQIQEYQTVKDLNPQTDDLRGALFNYRQDHPWYAGAPPAEATDRVKGVIYANPAGQRARWSGTGWVPVQ